MLTLLLIDVDEGWGGRHCDKWRGWFLERRRRRRRRRMRMRGRTAYFNILTFTNKIFHRPLHL
jgi:hypothetical protein